jgi:uncharacterized damage-inducible protein DinB
METPKWFDRQFDFRIGSDDEAAIYARLQEATEIVKQCVQNIGEDILVQKPEGTWSVKEQIGHLFIIEPLWRTRFEDIRQSRPALTPADLDNKATSAAGFNSRPVSDLVNAFGDERKKTISLLNTMNKEDKTKTSMHPRLQQPMRIIDLAYFVAEHDDHHIARIRQLIELFNK